MVAQLIRNFTVATVCLAVPVVFCSPALAQYDDSDGPKITGSKVSYEKYDPKKLKDFKSDRILLEKISSNQQEILKLLKEINQKLDSKSKR